MALATTYILAVFIGLIVYAVVRMNRAYRAERAAMSPAERAKADRDEDRAAQGW